MDIIEEYFNDVFDVGYYVECAVNRSLGYMCDNVIDATVYIHEADATIEGIALAVDVLRRERHLVKVKVDLMDIIMIENQYWDIEEPSEFLYTEDVGMVERIV